MALLPSGQEEQRKLLIGLLPLLGLFAYWNFFHGPAKEELQQMQTRLEQLETKNTRAKQMAARAGPELEKKLALYEQHIARLEKLIPSTEEVPELLHTMTLRAQEADVELAVVRPEVQEKGRYYTRRTYEITVVGAYHDVGRFLAAVGSLSRIVTPIDLSLTTARNDDEGEGARPLEASFRIETYVLPAAKPAEAGANATT